jgi:hypothetical protein
MSLELSGTTGVKGVAGSVSAPSIVGDDTNTGISFPSADTIKFSTGGVERMSITNSGVSGITAGITMVDQWRISDHFTVSTSETVVSTNWERNDSTAYAGIGTGMTESSGIFTFPSTGIYLIKAVGTTYGSGGTSINIALRVQGRKNSGSYSDLAQGSASAYTNNAYGTIYSEVLFDVESTSGDNIRLAAYSTTSSQMLLGGDLQRTGFTFLRLGDT